MFIKHGDGKIVTVLEEDKMTEEQKKAVKDSKQIQKQSNNDPDASEIKNSGR